MEKVGREWGESVMPVEWIKTNYPGVRYYKHKTRKHGVNFDRYFTVRYQFDGKRHEEGLGWASEGWSAEKAAIELADLKKATKLGSGAQRLHEKRALDKERRKQERIESEQKLLASMTFDQYFRETYYPNAEAHKKEGSYKAEFHLYEQWIEPSLGKMPFKMIKPLHIRGVKKRMTDAKKSTATIKYAYAVISQVWNHACSDGYISGDSPTKDKTVKLGRLNNERQKILTKDEAKKLLEALTLVSPKLHDMALLSLHCGLRAGEIFKLTWDCIDYQNGIILLKDTKSKK